MKTVMKKAQELAEAILESDCYNEMKKAEADMRRDPEAAAALGEMIEKRNRVEEILASANMDPNELAAASSEMEKAEKRMNEQDKIIALKEKRKDFQTMMDNVNRILRLVITGEVEEENGGTLACSGDCSACGGCH